MPNRSLRSASSLLAVLAWLSSSAGAAERVALVIGNGAYPSASLAFTGNDAAAMAETLRQSGFAVTEGLNLNAVDMRRAVTEFAKQADSAQVVLFYFAGHGVQTSRARNYLLPIDVAPDSNESEIQQGIDVEADVLPGLASNVAKRITIVILDACRLPARSRSNSVDAAFASSLVGGMARMNVPSGTFVAYGSQPGRRAVEDPESKHGRYSAALLKYLQMPGLSLEQVFKRTRSDVETSSGGQQSPREESALRGDQEFTFVEPGKQISIGTLAVIPSSALSPRRPATESSAAGGLGPALLATIRGTPRERRVRELRRLLESRAVTLQPEDVREILLSFWINARPRVLTLLDSQLARTFDAHDALSFLVLLDRRDLAEVMERYVQEARIVGGRGRDGGILADAWEKAKSSRVCSVQETPAKYVTTGPSTDVSRILEELGTDGQRMQRGLHEVLQKNDLQFSFDDAMKLLRAIPASHRAKVFGELLIAFPDRMTPKEMQAATDALRDSGSPDPASILELASRLDERISMPEARAIIGTFLGGGRDYYASSFAKFCPENESAVQFFTSLQLSLYEAMYLAKAGSYWNILTGADRLAFVSTRAVGERIAMLKFVLQNEPYVKVGIEQIAVALGNDTGDKSQLTIVIGVANTNNVIRKPLTDAELAILRSWFNAPSAQNLIEKLSR